MRKRFQILLFILISCCFTVHSQTASVILPSNFSGPVGTEIEIPVTVTNFDSICNISMVFQFDTAVLSYLGVTINNPTNSLNFAIGNIVGNQFRFAASGVSLLTLPDQDWIVKVKFIYNGGNSTLVWDQSPDNCVVGKCFVGEKPVNWVNGNCTPPAGLGTISGALVYDNSLQSTMSNCPVILLDSIGNPLDTTLTDESGLYVFQVNQTGSYGLRVVPSNPLSSVNSTDALLIIQHFVGLVNLNGLALKAADLNADSIVNSTDALIVLKRFVGLQTSFLNGDWVFDIPSVPMPVLSPLTIHMKALLKGDVDRSLVP